MLRPAVGIEQEERLVFRNVTAKGGQRVESIEQDGVDGMAWTIRLLNDQGEEQSKFVRSLTRLSGL